ncbi:hypothetical protein SODALDRAFT_321254 [Sodiomyces alkalinus F11]|uniref:diphosphoinositol-polyphosphate diphosphatase n=1 Tax=Sodiomyces alkalinus (strain CBS 110278 / VKM F-3762 / F11) TaxID=1314773 RepID=A0A3N2PL08_SODAK|nr:hypothetical protein SODALDRAFT_321254 [Sodiomyces alkalinus F11]ROT35221.1 hypothetical protein SODALDRAFT_321254 [Sodiomyces alkalinus F11]
MASKRSTRTFLDDCHHADVEVSGTPSCCARREENPSSLFSETQSSNSARRESREASLTVETPPPLPPIRKQGIAPSKVDHPPSASGRPDRGRDLRPLGLNLPSLPTTPSSMQRTIPMEGRPPNFGVVVPGVYRSSYPGPEDFPFIQQLGLNTMVTLGQKDELDEVYSNFLTVNAIRHHIIPMKGTKKERIPIQTMRDILRVVLDQQHYPLMIHCNHGKHRTGCVVAVIRKVSGWELDTILDEYKAYAAPKIRDCDVQYITEFELSELSNLFVHEANMRLRVRRFFRTTVFAFAVLFIWAVSSNRISYSAEIAGTLE